jgi:hypothetical protein
LLTKVFTIQGRVVGAAALDEVRQLLQEHPDWSRWRLSRQLALQWKWRNGTGLLKDMAARSLLLKLEQRGLIQLPARRRRCPNRMRLPPKAAEASLAEPITEKLSQLQPLRIEEVSRNARHRQTLAQLLHQHHYLSYTSPVGENLQYLVWDRHGRMLAGCVFGAAAWKCAPRDQFIGWDREGREAGLSWLCSQTRFLIPSWVEVKHLASHLLARWCRRLPTDWQVKYGHQVCLVESFVDADRFSGACYRAANWHHVGATQGRSRQDRHHQLCVSRKEIFLCPLLPHYRQVLSDSITRPRRPVAGPKPNSGLNEWIGL